MSSGGGAIELALDCEDAWNVRLEMEDARGAAREMRCERKRMASRWFFAFNFLH
jgi:hypothetical protein